MRLETETGSVEISDLPTGELYVTDLVGDASLILTVRQWCKENHPGRAIVLSVESFNVKMISAMITAGMEPTDILFRGVP